MLLMVFGAFGVMSVDVVDMHIIIIILRKMSWKHGILVPLAVDVRSQIKIYFLNLEMVVNNIKCVIGNGRGFGYHGYFLRFYYDEAGETYIAEPVELKFKKLPPSLACEPTLFIDKLSMDNFVEESDNKYKSMLSQKHEDKNKHIENLNELLKLVLGERR